jgi:alkylation response protein AidB-like acyl-CoA dehydrogenase
MGTTWAALNGEVGELATEWRADRPARQARRGLDPGDFARLARAGFLDVAVPEARGGLWRSVAETTGPICAVLRTLAAARSGGRSRRSRGAAGTSCARGRWRLPTVRRPVTSRALPTV